MKRILLSMIMLAVLIPSAYAKDSNELEEVDRLIKTEVQKVLEVLRDDDLNHKERLKRVEPIISGMFNFKLMAMLTLGRKHWRQLSNEERQTYVDLYIRQLQLSYIGKATALAKQEVHFDSPNWIDKSSKKVQTATYITERGERNEAIYKFYKTNDEWKIYDVEIEGVSIIKSYGSQYREVLNQHSVKKLLERMRQTIEKGLKLSEERVEKDAKDAENSDN